MNRFDKTMNRGKRLGAYIKGARQRSEEQKQKDREKMKNYMDAPKFTEQRDKEYFMEPDHKLHNSIRNDYMRKQNRRKWEINSVKRMMDAPKYTDQMLKKKVAQEPDERKREEIGLPKVRQSKPVNLPKIANDEDTAYEMWFKRRTRK